MGEVLLVGIGGFAGSAFRYILSGLVQRASHSVDLPYGTLAVNVLGCLLMGMVAHLADSRGAFTPQTRALLTVGVLGGFTTFSTLSNETFNLLHDREVALALANLGAQIVLGLGAIWLGHIVARLVWR